MKPYRSSFDLESNKDFRLISLQPGEFTNDFLGFSVSSDICSGHLVIDLFNFQAHGQFTRFHILRAHS